MAFSYFMSPNIAHIYIYAHFRQLRQDGQPEWYMAEISGFQTDENEDVARLRGDFHNTLDWGILERIKEIKKVFDDVRRNGAVELLSPLSKERRA
jgi:hypothetical protein